MMTRTQAKTRLLQLAQVVTEESQQHPRRGLLRAGLLRCSLQLAHLARIAGRPDSDVDPAMIESYIAEAIVLVSRAAASRIPEVSPW